MKKLLLTVFISLLTISYAAAQDASAMIEKIKSLKSYKADFVQKTEIEGFGEDVYEGTVYVMKGHKALWDYDEPVEQYYLFTTGGFDYYDSETNQLIRQKMSKDKGNNIVLELMLDPSTINRNFKTEAAGETLILFPQTDIGVEKVELQVNDKGAITYMHSVDTAGNSTRIEFENIETNKVIAEEIFDKKVPEGTEIFTY